MFVIGHIIAGNTWHTFKFKLPEAPNSKWRLPYLIYPIKYFKFYFFKYVVDVFQDLLVKVYTRRREIWE
ncbi:unnamed protein product [Trifolium pratense]|uniref:Uncharacterized protein n=1 Tax=Trifolium pratense TaxID=57577 RepID=A0ACB0KWC4_TRIPR|nr:unnamed protein product [Trifolium pratense]